MKYSFSLFAEASFDKTLIRSYNLDSVLICSVLVSQSSFQLLVCHSWAQFETFFDQSVSQSVVFQDSVYGFSTAGQLSLLLYFLIADFRFEVCNLCDMLTVTDEEEFETFRLWFWNPCEAYICLREGEYNCYSRHICDLGQRDRCDFLRSLLNQYFTLIWTQFLSMSHISSIWP